MVVLILLAKIGAAIVGGGTIGKALYWCWESAANSRQLVKDVSTVATLAPLAGVLLREFRPNGGSSLKDQVNKIEEKVIEAGNQAAAAKSEAAALKIATDKQDIVLADISRKVNSFCGDKKITDSL